MPTEICEHCGRQMGVRETAHVHHDRIVCGPCWRVLYHTEQSSLATPRQPATCVRPAAPTAAPAAPARSFSPTAVWSPLSSDGGVTSVLEPADYKSSILIRPAPAPAPSAAPAPARPAGDDDSFVDRPGFKTSILIRPAPDLPPRPPPPATPPTIPPTAPAARNAPRQLNSPPPAAARAVTERQRPPQHRPAPASSAAALVEEVLARLGDVTVTTRVIDCPRWGRVPVAQLVAATPSGSIVMGAAVDLRDADGTVRRYKFSTAPAARTFLQAVLSANRSIRVEQTDPGPGCYVWT